MENENNIPGSLEPIPKLFYSDAEKSEFQNCTFCNKEVQSSGEMYMIEKSFKINPNNGQKNTVFEYAICMSCSIKKMNAMSKESIENIQNYMKEHVMMDNINNVKCPADRFSSCIATGEPVENLSEYNVVGQFIGDQMIKGPFPFLLSPAVGEEVQELLSQQTKDEFDDFMDTITDVPPELKALFKTKRPVLV